jgi:hypothetical protein
MSALYLNSYDTGEWTQGLLPAKQVLYHLSYTTSPNEQLLFHK